MKEFKSLKIKTPSFRNIFNNKEYNVVQTEANEAQKREQAKMKETSRKSIDTQISELKASLAVKLKKIEKLELELRLEKLGLHSSKTKEDEDNGETINNESNDQEGSQEKENETETETKTHLTKSLTEENDHPKSDPSEQQQQQQYHMIDLNETGQDIISSSLNRSSSFRHKKESEFSQLYTLRPPPLDTSNQSEWEEIELRDNHVQRRRTQTLPSKFSNLVPINKKKNSDRSLLEKASTIPSEIRKRVPLNKGKNSSNSLLEKPKLSLARRTISVPFQI